MAGGNTHAWLQAYIPGPGWVDIDPSSGTVGNANLVRVAVVHDPRDAIPLQGTWIGKATDHLAMDDKLWNRLRAVYSDDELVDLGLSVAAWLALGRVNQVFGIDGACRIPPRGYEPIEPPTGD